MISFTESLLQRDPDKNGYNDFMFRDIINFVC